MALFSVRANESASSADGFKQVNGMGTGVIIDDRGYVITNYHVIEGVRQIQVTLDSKRLPDGTQANGQTVVGQLIAHKYIVPILKFKLCALKDCAHRAGCIIILGHLTRDQL